MADSTQSGGTQTQVDLQMMGQQFTERERTAKQWTKSERSSYISQVETHLQRMQDIDHQNT